MRSVKWNNAEDSALQGLSMLAQLIYLRVFRRRMDYATGIAGLHARIDYQAICEAVGFVPDPGSQAPRWIPSKGEVRAAIKELERILPDQGREVPLLIEAGSGPHRGYLKRLPLAALDRSAQKGNDAGTTQERRKTNDTANDAGKCVETQAYQMDAEDDQRDEQRSEKNCCAAMNVTPTVSGIREENLEERGMDRAQPPPKSSRGSRLSIPELPPEWREFATSTRPDLDPDFCWQKFRDYWVAVPGQKGCKADWLATWRNFIRSEHARRANGNGQHHAHQSAVERHRSINKQLIAAARAAGPLD